MIAHPTKMVAQKNIISSRGFRGHRRGIFLFILPPLSRKTSAEILPRVRGVLLVINTVIFNQMNLCDVVILSLSNLGRTNDRFFYPSSSAGIIITPSRLASSRRTRVTVEKM